MTSPNGSPLTLALPKGRILKELSPLLAQAGIDVSPLQGDSRRLMLDTNDGAVRMLLLRPSDVPTYVSYGVADVGVSGADTLLEEQVDLLEPLDLGLGKCRLVVAAPAERAADGFKQPWIKVATKYPNITRQFFRRRGIEAIIVKLYGSVELACISGLADLVVDLVSTGATLKANKLVEIETIAEISSRLVVNRASLKTRCVEIDALIQSLRGALG
jgi:ATP phosphoribosyltransferase